MPDPNSIQFDQLTHSSFGLGRVWCWSGLGLVLIILSLDSTGHGLILDMVLAKVVLEPNAT